MSVPRSVVKLSRKGVEYTSSVDFAQYTIRELTRAALRDVGRFVSRTSNTQAMRLKGLSKSRRTRGKTSAFQFWVRRQETDLQVGIKHGTWYGTEQELGTSKMKKLGILRNTVEGNIAQIIEIESQYLSAINDGADAAEALIDEREHQGGGDDD